MSNVFLVIIILLLVLGVLLIYSARTRVVDFIDKLEQDIDNLFRGGRVNPTEIRNRVAALNDKYRDTPFGQFVSEATKHITNNGGSLESLNSAFNALTARSKGPDTQKLNNLYAKILSKAKTCNCGK